MAVGGFGSPSSAHVTTRLPMGSDRLYYKPSELSYGGSGTSARGVASTSRSGSSMAERSADSLSLALDQIYKLSEQNTARSEAQAAGLRNWQQQQNQIAMNFNAAEAAKNRDWQQMMSNTAHQREVADLQAAGLNPVLSAMGGSGASVTSGATASGVTSSGSQGQVDTGATQALVGLLGTMWSAQTQLEMQRASAENNLAIADKNAEVQRVVAEMYTQQSREASILAAATGLQESEISAAASRAVAATQAAASRYASDTSRVNSELAAQVQKEVSQMNVDQREREKLYNGILSMSQTKMQLENAFNIADLTSGRQVSSALDVAQERHKDNPYGTIQSAFENMANFFKGSSPSGFTGRSKPRGGGFSPR